MACYQTSTQVQLASHEAITLPDVRGATLRVTRGTLWLTQEHRHNDVVLRNGDTFVVEFDGNTVVEAQHDASFMLLGPRGQNLALPRCVAPLARLASHLAGWLAAPRHVPYF